MVGNKIISGKRKSAIAKARIFEGKGKVTFNGRNYETLDELKRLRIAEPIRIAEHILGEMKYDVSIKVSGGGERGQIEAARLALAKALVSLSKSKKLEEAFLEYDRHMLVADVRRKEACKPGDSKARAKRQTSYR